MSAAPSPPPTTYADSPCTYPRNLDLDPDALVASSLRVLEQRTAPSMHEILAAYTAKGDGDREMLFALLNAKTAEDNRMAADRNLRRTLLEYCRSPAGHAPSMYLGHRHEMPQYPLPSPPTSLYQQSPAILTHSPPPRRRTASSSSSLSSEEHSHSQHLRKRRRSRSPSRHDYRDYRARPPYEPHAGQSDGTPRAHSPYRSQSSSSQLSSSSPRSRQSMTIGSLLSARGGAEYQEAERRVDSPPS